MIEKPHDTILIPEGRYEDLIKVKDLVPYERNAKKHTTEQVTLICNLILKQGFLDPIEVRSKNDLTIVCGHGRLQAAKKLGMSTVPVVFVGHLSDVEVKARRLSHNRSAESSWEKALLREELIELNEEDISFEDCGFTDDEFNALLTINEGKPDEDYLKDSDMAEEVSQIQHVRIECPQCGFLFKKKKEDEE